MKRIFSVILVICMCAALIVGCAAEEKTSLPEATLKEDAPDPQEMIDAPLNHPESSVKLENLDQALLDQIAITYKADGWISDSGKQRVIVTIVNNSEKIFSGDIPVNFKDKNGKSLGYDIIMVENLGIGQNTCSNIFIMPGDDVQLSSKFSDGYSFAEAPPSSGGEFDEETTKALIEMMHSNFGGSGKAEFAASWYEYVDTFEVYKAGDDYYAHVILRTIDVKQEAKKILQDMSTLRSADPSQITALEALGIPATQYLCEGGGWERDKVTDALYNSNVPGDAAAKCINDYMEHDQIGQEQPLPYVKYIANAVAGFKDANLKMVIIQDSAGNKLYERQK